MNVVASVAMNVVVTFVVVAVVVVELTVVGETIVDVGDVYVAAVE